MCLLRVIGYVCAGWFRGDGGFCRVLFVGFRGWVGEVGFF